MVGNQTKGPLGMYTTHLSRSLVLAQCLHAASHFRDDAISESEDEQEGEKTLPPVGQGAGVEIDVDKPKEVTRSQVWNSVMTGLMAEWPDLKALGDTTSPPRAKM